MIPVVIVIHLMLAVALIAVILLQKSEGGALGMGGGGMSGFMTGRSAANLLTRTTAILAALFFATSIGLALLASAQRGTHSLIDQIPASAPSSSPLSAPPASSPTGSTAPTPVPPTVPAAPATPAAPLAK